MRIELGETLYANALARPADVAGWRMEGDGALSFPLGRLRMESTRPPDEGQAANLVHWCPEEFPDHIAVSWDFCPIRQPGLAIVFFAARGRGGEDIFDARLAPRHGPYEQYHSGDINALHASYFRRNRNADRALRTCNLRKSHGFHLVCQGADPLPDVAGAMPPHRIQAVKSGPHVLFSIADLRLFHWVDDGTTHGPVLGGGKIGFRQMSPLIADYANLRVERVRE